MPVYLWLPVVLSIAVTLGVKYYFQKEITLWEMALPPIVTLITVLVVNSIALNLTTRDTEYWGGWVTKAVYYERWDEEVPCIHARYRTETYDCGTSDKPATCSRQVFDGWEHMYDVDDHPEHWVAETSNDTEYEITRNYFTLLCSQFNNKSFQDMHRDYHRIDGDAYVTEWDSKFDTVESVVEKHTYTNKVANSTSLFKFPEIDPKTTPVFAYPDVNGFSCPSVLGAPGLPNSEDIDKVNSLLGASSKIKVWVLIWEGYFDRQVAFDQKAFWKGSNKNELVICININSVKDPKVNWCEVFSWSDSEELKTSIVSFVSEENKTLDLKELANYLYKNIPSKWTKKNWHDFDYISVDIPPLGLFFIWLVAVLSTGGTLYWSIVNEHRENDRTS